MGIDIFTLRRDWDYLVLRQSVCDEVSENWTENTKRLARSSEMFCVGVLNERFRFPGVERAGAVCVGMC